MKKIIFTLVGISFLIFSCQNELLDLQESSLQSESFSSSQQSGIVKCKVIDLERCDRPLAANFWWPDRNAGDTYDFFSSTEDHKLTFVQYSDGTANILGSTVMGSCIVTVNVWIEDKKDWNAWSNSGGTIKAEPRGCTTVVPEDMSFYIINKEKSYIIATGGDCLEEGTFGVEQRPDPENATDGNPNTYHLGVIVGPGGGLFDKNENLAYGLSTWGWLTNKSTGARLSHIIDFNFNFDECEEVECKDCEGNVTELTLQYNGTEDAHIEVKTKDEGVNGSKIVFEGNVGPGDQFTINGNDENGTFGDEIKVYVDGDYVKIKTDCSEAIGPGLIIEDIEVISGKSSNGAYLCPKACDECEGKVTRLDLQYNGADKTIEIVQKKDGTEGTPLFSGPVSAGDEFTIYGQDDKGTLSTEIIITDASGTEIQRIHTSCSEPIGAGAVFGDFTVIGGASRNGGELCPVDTPPGGDCDECKGGVISFTVEYTGISDATLKVMEKDVEIFNAVILPGQLITLSGTKDDGKFEENNLIFTLNGNVLSAPEHDPGEIHVSCSKPFYVGLPIGDSLVVTAGTSKDNGTICEDTPPGGGDDCNECDGKVTRLELQYSGSGTDSIKIVQKKDGEIVFNGTTDGNPIEIFGEWKKGTFGTELIIYVKGYEAQRIHTSCSVPIGVGSVFGDFTVLSGASYNGGEFCNPEGAS